MNKHILILLTTTMISTGMSQDQQVLLDHVSGQTGVDSVAAGRQITFHIRLSNQTDSKFNFANGFRVWSPDGAEWDYPVRDTVYCEDVWWWWPDYCVFDSFSVDSVVFDEEFQTNFHRTDISYFSVDGVDTDTVLIWGVSDHHSRGAPAWYSGVPLHIPIRTRVEDTGKTICIDSAWLQWGAWTWWPPGTGDSTRPGWSGKRCFTIVDRCSCVGLSGNIDGDSINLIDIGDLTALIGHLYMPSWGGICLPEANVNGGVDYIVDISDLQYLISHLYIPPNPPLAPCP